MADKFIKGYVQQKHDIFANWELSSLIPAAGQIIIYDDGEGNENTPKIKVGNGVNYVHELPFASGTGGGVVYSAYPPESTNVIWAQEVFEPEPQYDGSVSLTGAYDYTQTGGTVALQ